MSRKLETEHPERERPKLPETPFLCASCKFGLMLLQKLPQYSKKECRENPALSATDFWWDWEARCSNEQIAIRAPEPFFFPVVDCEGFEARDLETPEQPESEEQPPAPKPEALIGCCRMSTRKPITLRRLRKALRRGFRDGLQVFGLRRVKPEERARKHFQTPLYLDHNRRRQDHLAGLGLDLENRSVLEVGAGVGDHTAFWLERGCRVLITEPREENLAALRARYPDQEVRALDLDRPEGFDPERRFEIVYCYGTLYHLEHPAEALQFLAGLCDDLLLLETCVQPGAGEELARREEAADWPSQSVSGVGSRPTRRWIQGRLKESFEHVYLPTTQPDHPEFPLDWTGLRRDAVARAVFVASRAPLDSPLLLEGIPDRQTALGPDRDIQG